MNSKIEISIQSSKRFPASQKKQIRKSARLTLEMIPKSILRKKTKAISKGTITIAIVSPKQIQSLNLKYRGKNKPTDVLSFSRMETKTEFFPIFCSDLGDVLICAKVASEQARREGITLKQELSKLAIHGILHLFGYDHEISDKEEKRMFRLQDKILSNL